MRSSIKIPLLLTFFFFNAYALDLSSLDDSSFNYGMNQSFLPYGVSAQSISDVEILNSSFLKINNDIYAYRFDEWVFNLSKSNASGYYYEGNLSYIATLYYYDSKFEKITIPCEGSDVNNLRACSRRYVLGSKDVLPVEFSYYRKYSINKVRSCESDENFNTDTHQCQKCSDGHSWDPQTNTCYKDCSKDGKINKVGLPDGRCIDCSGEKDSFAVLKCLCSGFGLGGGNTFWSKYGSSSSDCKLQGSCSDGSQISFINPKCSVKPDPKPDDNKTKPDDPNPNPDNNKTNPGDPNNPNQGGNQGGNNGGNQGNNPKPNPNPGNNTNPKPGNNDGDKNKDADAKFNPGDFDYSDLKRDEEQFTNKFKGALDDVLKDFDGFKQGVDQFINNVRGKGLSDVNKHSKPTTCVKKYEIDFFGYKTSIEFDFCNVASMVSGAFYYIFYAFFFYCFLILIVKILLFAF